MASVDLFGNVATTFVAITCSTDGCGVIFGMESGYYKARVEDHKGWHCPNGHVRYFSGKSKAEKLEEELRAKNRELEFARADISRARARARTAEHGRAVISGRYQSMKNRVAHGVCPCCNRTFQNLTRHMATKHPKWRVPEKEA